MRVRTVILVLACVLVFNALVVLGVWLWFRPANAAKAESAPVAAEADSATGIEPVPTEGTAETSPSPALAAPNARAVWAEIESPHDGDAVPRKFVASGRCSPIPEGGHLMLVIDSGRGVYSPKMPALTVDGSNWTGEANEFGVRAGGSFSLCVFLVSDEALQQIAQWHAQGKATGKYPPFRQGVPGGTSLAQIQLRVAGGGNP